MQQIADWLKKLGMSEYGQRFAENGKNLEALRYLTDQDLRDIGVLLGHRRIMLAAIGELAGSAVSLPLCAPAIEPKPKGAPKTPRYSRPQRPRPRRILQVSAVTSQ